MKALGYPLMIAGAVGLFLAVRHFGEQLPAPPPLPDAPAAGVQAGPKVDVVAHVFACLAAVVALGHLLGRAMARFGQPPVIGEILAGIALGPSLLGAVWPEATHAFLPPPADDPQRQVPAALRAISQVGVALYMFLVGLDLNAARLKGHAHAAVAISHAGIVAPFAVGSLLALAAYPALGHAGVPFTSFALFLGAAMSVTAFPVLARILADKRLDRTPLGALALGCAATDDVTAWCLLALVVGVAKQDPGHAVAVTAMAAGFIALVLLAVRPALARLSAKLDATPGPLPSGAFPLLLAAALGSALATEQIGIHAIFGAFLLGAVVPSESRLAAEARDRMGGLVGVLLLPAFFMVTGMRTKVGLVSGWEAWGWCLAVVAVATLGKLGGTLAAARLSGFGWRQGLALGALMNSRGLMGLIVLDVGMEMGVVTPQLFAMMVIMCVATTLAAAPLLRLALRSPADAELAAEEAEPEAVAAGG